MACWVQLKRYGVEKEACEIKSESADSKMGEYKGLCNIQADEPHGPRSATELRVSVINFKVLGTVEQTVGASRGICND